MVQKNPLHRFSALNHSLGYLSLGLLSLGFLGGLPGLPPAQGLAGPSTAWAAAAGDWKGTLFRQIDSDPGTLNAVTSEDAYASVIHGYVFSSLLERDEDTYEWIPAMADKWDISKDGRTFTFHLRPGIKWHDGQPLTAEDVKYSFDVYFEGRFQAPHIQVYLQNIKEVKIVDPQTVQFIVKEVYFKNFEVAAGITIIPKHFYGVGDPGDAKFNKELIGTGPYILSEWEKGQKIVLKRNPDFWGNDLPYHKDRYKFARVVFRPVKEETVALELLKKGDLDFLGLTPEQYVTKTKGPEWGTKVVAVKVENSMPQNYNYGYIGWNQLNPLFKTKQVRQAMSYLINRDLMIEKFRYGMSEKATGPFGNKSPSSSPKVKAIEYNPRKALELLKGQGWKLGATGMTKLVDGKEIPFEFTLICANPDFEKYLTVIKEDMKKVGVTMNIKFVEWNSFLKLVDERKFDALNMGWQINSLEDDPKQVWHSESIKAPGHNFISYNNPALDKLIDQIRANMDPKSRRKQLQKVHEIIAEDQPYSFLFNSKFTLYGNTTRIKKPRDTAKYSIGLDTWKVDE